MFPTRYFGNRMFAPRYWPKVGASPAPVTDLGAITTSMLLMGVGH